MGFGEQDKVFFVKFLLKYRQVIYNKKHVSCIFIRGGTIMTYEKITPEIIEKLKSVVGPETSSLTQMPCSLIPMTK